MSIALRFTPRSVVASLIAAMAFVGGTATAASIADEWASVQVPPPPALKAVTLDRKTTALLLLAAARAAGVPVLYSLGGGGAAADIAKELTPTKD